MWKILCLVLALLALAACAVAWKERRANTNMRREQEALTAAQAHLRPFVLGQIIQGHSPEFERLEDFNRIYGLNFGSGAFMLLVVKLRSHPFGTSPAGQEQAYAMVQDELTGILGLTAELNFAVQDGLLVCFYTEPRVTLDPPSGNQKYLRDLLEQQCGACAASLMDHCGIDVIIALGRYDLGGFALHTNYISAKALLEQAICSRWSGNVVVDAGELSQTMDMELANTQRQFYNCFICFHYADAANHLFHMVELRIDNYCDTFREAREIVARELQFCTSMLELPFNVQLEPGDGGTINIRDVMFSTDLDNLRENLSRYFQGLANKTAVDSAKTAPITSRVYEYIEAHYREPSLSVSKIGDRFGLNVSYLSRQFKQAYGLGVLEFIHRNRITEAKSLMADGMPISEVLERVGYTSRRAFDSAFSRQEGLTPKAYQDQLLAGQKRR